MSLTTHGLVGSLKYQGRNTHFNVDLDVSSLPNESLLFLARKGLTSYLSSDLSAKVEFKKRQFANDVKKMNLAEGEIAPEFDEDSYMEQLRSEALGYLSSGEFPVPMRGRRSKSNKSPAASPVEKKIMALAEESVRAYFHSHNLTLPRAGDAVVTTPEGKSSTKSQLVLSFMEANREFLTKEAEHELKTEAKSKGKLVEKLNFSSLS